jgi:hypothetical protein
MSRAALAVLFNKTPPCPPVASHNLTLVGAGESQPVAFSHNRDTSWQERQETTRSVARAPTSAARVHRERQVAPGRANGPAVGRAEQGLRHAGAQQWARATFWGAKPITGFGSGGSNGQRRHRTRRRKAHDSPSPGALSGGLGRQGSEIGRQAPEAPRGGLPACQGRGTDGHRGAEAVKR